LANRLNRTGQRRVAFVLLARGRDNQRREERKKEKKRKEERTEKRKKEERRKEDIQR